jgi:hypothetical protein
LQGYEGRITFTWIARIRKRLVTGKGSNTGSYGVGGGEELEDEDKKQGKSAFVIEVG